ncbi:hypothetical protein, partial [Streptomyces sp. NPDC020951]|uniref:hypothetical protein n=1 Tax=Streptomyces sp. NPDC020951 TaxID=3365104 RepID=UPI00378D879F
VPNTPGPRPGSQVRGDASHQISELAVRPAEAEAVHLPALSITVGIHHKDFNDPIQQQSPALRSCSITHHKA